MGKSRIKLSTAEISLSEKTLTIRPKKTHRAHAAILNKEINTSNKKTHALSKFVSNAALERYQIPQFLPEGAGRADPSLLLLSDPQSSTEKTLYLLDPNTPPTAAVSSDLLFKAMGVAFINSVRHVTVVSTGKGHSTNAKLAIDAAKESFFPIQIRVRSLPEYIDLMQINVSEGHVMERLIKDSSQSLPPRQRKVRKGLDISDTDNTLLPLNTLYDLSGNAKFRNSAYKLPPIKQSEDYERNDGKFLEWFSWEIFRTLGYNVKYPGNSSDFGSDLLLDEGTPSQHLVQCKHKSEKVDIHEMFKIIGAMVARKIKNSSIIAPTGFSSDAKNLASKALALGLNIELVDIGKLITLGAQALYRQERLPHRATFETESLSSQPARGVKIFFEQLTKKEPQYELLLESFRVGSPSAQDFGLKLEKAIKESPFDRETFWRRACYARLLSAFAGSPDWGIIGNKSSDPSLFLAQGLSSGLALSCSLQRDHALGDLNTLIKLRRSDDDFFTIQGIKFQKSEKDHSRYTMNMYIDDFDLGFGPVEFDVYYNQEIVHSNLKSVTIPNLLSFASLPDVSLPYVEKERALSFQESPDKAF